MIFYIPHEVNPTKVEIKAVLDYYEKYKEEIDLEIPGTKYDYFRKGRVTYLVDKNNNLIKG